MRSLIFLLFTIFLTSVSYSNDLKNLTPLDFENDTANYITYVFGENKRNYVNKRLSHLIDDYDINIGYVRPNVDSNNLLYRISLYYDEKTEVIAQTKIGHIYIDIDFTEPYIDFESLKYLWDNSTEEEKLDLLRENIVEDIDIGVSALFH